MGEAWGRGTSFLLLVPKCASEGKLTEQQYDLLQDRHFLHFFVVLFTVAFLHETQTKNTPKKDPCATQAKNSQAPPIVFASNSL